MTILRFVFCYHVMQIGNTRIHLALARVLTGEMLLGISLQHRYMLTPESDRGLEQLFVQHLLCDAARGSIHESLQGLLLGFYVSAEINELINIHPLLGMLVLYKCYPFKL